MAIVSDDLALLGPDAARTLAETVDIGRAADDEARAGRPARALDLLDGSPPTRLAAAGRLLTVDPSTGESTLSASPPPSP
jgi:hypothetical protein